MEPSVKKRRLNKQPASYKLAFLDLNDDCIFSIFTKMSPTDLCSMSFTCKRMQELTFDYFPRQYPDERVTITAADNTNIPYFCVGATKKYLKYFSKCIKNVCITSTVTYDNLQCLFDFLITECCAKLRTLHLDITGLLKPVHVEVIRSRLKDLSTLIINGPHIRLDIHNVLLKYCEKLEDLQLYLIGRFDFIWMINEYPTIKSLSIRLMDSESIKLFDALSKKFFQLNPQIKNIECSGMEDDTEWNKLKKTLLLNVINVERLDLIPMRMGGCGVGKSIEN